MAPHAAAVEIHADSTVRVLKSASELDYPPFALVRPDRSADGFSVELLRAVARTMGVPVEINVGPWPEIKQKLARGDLDLLPLVSYSRQRDEVFDFSVPYLRMHGTIFVRKGETAIRSEADLKGKEVIVMRGDTAHEYVLRKKLSDKLVLTDNFSDAMIMLSEGKHDAVVIQQLVGLQLIKKLGITNLSDVAPYHGESLKPIGKPLEDFEQKFCIAVHEGDHDLLALLNEGLSIVFADGTYDKLYAKWFGPILPRPPVPLREILKSVLLVLVPVVFLLAAIGFFYMKREVANKTRSLKQEVLERAAAVHKLRESQTHLESVFRAAPTGIGVTVERRIREANSRLCEMVGYAKSELIDQSARILYPDDEEFKRVGSEKYSQIRRNGTGTVETRWQHKDGRILDILLSSTPFDLDDLSKGVTFTALDITHRKRAEELLQLTQFAIDHAFEAIFWHGPDARLIYVNDAACNSLGYDRDELLSMTVHDIDPEFPPEAWPAHWEELQRRGSFLIESKHRRKDGRAIPVEIRVNYIKYDGQEYNQSFVRDITSRKKVEEERLNLERQIQQAQKLESLGMLAGGIAHDFNNILMTILGNADIALQDMSHYSPVRDNIREIEVAARRAAELSRQMLAYSGKGKFVIEPIKINELVVEMGHMLEVTISKKAVLKFNYADNLPEFDGDATQIRQVIMNLIMNASEAIGDRSGVVAISTGAMHCDRQYLHTTNIASQVGLEQQLPEGVYIYFEVADTGCGMTGETQEKLFDPFFTTKFTGRGLGMAAVLGIVRGHNGTIKIYSELGKGTTIKVLFPATAVKGDQPDRKMECRTTKTPDICGSGTVLIADDEASVCAVGKLMLERIGFKVLTAADGAEAVEVFRQHTDEIVCVLLDLTMPRLNGEQVFSELRRINPQVSVILSSGYNEYDATQRFSGKGLAGFIQKPYNSATLTAKIKHVMLMGIAESDCPSDNDSGGR
ncbi:MAG: transporter substrate-binding domain-containing protein [Desulfobacteraceae bacterium]